MIVSSAAADTSKIPGMSPTNALLTSSRSSSCATSSSSSSLANRSRILIALSRSLIVIPISGITIRMPFTVNARTVKLCAFAASPPARPRSHHPHTRISRSTGVPYSVESVGEGTTVVTQCSDAGSVAAAGAAGSASTQSRVTLRRKARGHEGRESVRRTPYSKRTPVLVDITLSRQTTLSPPKSNARARSTLPRFFWVF